MEPISKGIYSKGAQCYSKHHTRGCTPSCSPRRSYHANVRARAHATTQPRPRTRATAWRVCACVLSTQHTHTHTHTHAHTHTHTHTHARTHVLISRARRTAQVAPQPPRRRVLQYPQTVPAAGVRVRRRRGTPRARAGAGVQECELRQRADPAADRAGEAVRAQGAAQHRTRAWAHRLGGSAAAPGLPRRAGFAGVGRTARRGR